MEVNIDVNRYTINIHNSVTCDVIDTGISSIAFYGELDKKIQYFIFIYKIRNIDFTEFESNRDKIYNKYGLF